jgi:hypothetical protein
LIGKNKMDKRILHTNPDGGVAVIVPTGEVPIEIVARKDVPQGVPYKIINLSDFEEVLSDRTFRDAWELGDFTPDGFGDPEGYWAEQNEASK